MIIDLTGKKSSRINFSTGDILIFYNDKEYDFHQVVFDNHGGTFRLLSLEGSKVNDKWNSLLTMIEDLNEEKNGFRLVEVLKSDEVVLRRVAHE
ncbi:MAG TPA: hypothetical protein VFC79_03275 [Tissierellaceae bacterium]|nr:hypothetical protein [Tissierellaceae bacterium]